MLAFSTATPYSIRLPSLLNAALVNCKGSAKLGFVELGAATDSTRTDCVQVLALPMVF